MRENVLPVLKVHPDDIAARVLVVGDPGRAGQAAALLSGARKVGENREYTTYTGTFEGVAVTICSHGVGSAGAAVCFEELARGGAQTIVRCGTCGAIQDGIPDGDLIIATGAVRDEGLTRRLVPVGYPALAHHQVIEALARAASRAGARAHTGVVLSTDLFYPSRALGNHDWPVWQASRVLAIEMELAALLIVAGLHGIRAGGILTVDGNPVKSAADMSDYDPHRSVVAEGVTTMLHVALTAIAGLR